MSAESTGNICSRITAVVRPVPGYIPLVRSRIIIPERKHRLGLCQSDYLVRLIHSLADLPAAKYMAGRRCEQIDIQVWQLDLLPFPGIYCLNRFHTGFCVHIKIQSIRFRYFGFSLLYVLRIHCILNLYKVIIRFFCEYHA